MAYYLQFDGVNDYVSVPETTYNSGDIFQILITGFTGAGSENRYLIDSEANIGSIRPYIIVRTDGTVQFNTAIISSLSIDGVPATGRSTIFPVDGADHEVSITLSAQARLGRVGSRLNNIQTWNAGIKSLKITRGASTLNDYDPSASNGTGQILPDTVGGNDGTLVNFPTDNSQWIFYDDGTGGEVEQSISTSSITSLESFGNSSLGLGTVFLQPPSLTSSEILGTPSLEEAGVILQPSSVSSQEFVDSPSVDVGLVFVNALSIPSQEIMGQPSLDKLLQEVIANSLSGQSQIGRPSVEGGDKIAIPILQRYTYQAVREHLLSLGFEGQVNEVILKWLRSEGFEGQFNEAFFKYLESEGYTGDLSTKFFKWKQS